MQILQLILDAVKGMAMGLVPLLLYLLRQRWKSRQRETSDNSALGLARIQDAAQRERDFYALLEQERAKTEQWREKYYQSQIEAATAREPKSVTSLKHEAKIRELEERVQELEQQRQKCHCKDDEDSQ